jgi:hypothetical protein
MNANPITALLREGPLAANIGVRDFAESLAEQDVPVVQVDWTPPPELDDDLADLLEELG